jgi:hypothetical protein
VVFHAHLNFVLPWPSLERLCKRTTVHVLSAGQSQQLKNRRGEVNVPGWDLVQ